MQNILSDRQDLHVPPDDHYHEPDWRYAYRQHICSDACIVTPEGWHRLPKKMHIVLVCTKCGSMSVQEAPSV